MWYHSLQRKEGCGIVQKLNPLGRFNSQSCLVRTRRHFASLRNCQGPCREQQQLCSLHKNLHRPAVPQYPSNIFYSYFVFSPFVFDDLSAAMKSSSSRVELSSSCSSFSIRRLPSSRISKKPTWKSGISASEFCSFSWNVLQIFLRETFWRSNCGPYSEMRSAYNAHSDLVMEYLSRNRVTSKRPFPFLLSYFSNVVNLENNGTSHQFIFEQVHYKAFSIT